jgi:2-polyprenyl-3-methyl-5-hydroxy-6-metoxy-1,4-benzoquinol methylase
MNYFARNERIIELARGKRVLHLGCVGFADLPTADRIALAEASLHFALSTVADVTGVDYSRDAIEYFRAHGVFDNVVFGDAEWLQDAGLVGPFDIVVAGDIIEHLSNPGLMLDGLRGLCDEHSQVVITTPHAFGLLRFLRYLAGRFVEGNEHVATFNESNLVNLCARHGLRVVSIDTCYQGNATKKRLFWLGKRFFELFPRLGGTLFVVAHRAVVDPARAAGPAGRAP